MEGKVHCPLIGALYQERIDTDRQLVVIMIGFVRLTDQMTYQFISD